MKGGVHWYHSGWLTPLLALIHEDIREFVKDSPKIVKGIFKKEKTMNIIEALAKAPGLIVKITTTVEDVKKVLNKLENDPDAQKVLTDISGLEAEIKSLGGSPQ